VLDNNGDKLSVVSAVTRIIDSLVLTICWNQLRLTDCEGQSIVEASVVRFSVLQVNKIGRCMLRS
jgi:hypothetical protein